MLLLVDGDSATDSLAPLAARRLRFLLGDHSVCDITLHWRSLGDRGAGVRHHSAGSPTLVCDATLRRLRTVCVITAPLELPEVCDTHSALVLLSGLPEAL